MTRKMWSVPVVCACLTMVVAAQDNVRMFKSEYFPLQPGATWLYRSTDPKAGEQKVSIRVEKVDVLDIKKGDKTEKVAAHRLLVTKDDRAKAEFVAVMDDGVYRFVDGKDTQPVCILKLPLTKDGETWQIDTVLDGMPLKGTFIAKKAEVKVADKSYSTWTVTGNDFEIGKQKMSIEYCFALNVGIVRQKVKLGTYEVTLELEKFTPGK